MNNLEKNNYSALKCEKKDCNGCSVKREDCAVAIKRDGDNALKSNKPYDAIRYYKQAVFFEPEYFSGWSALSKAYNEINEPGNAMLAAEKAAKADRGMEVNLLSLLNKYGYQIAKSKNLLVNDSIREALAECKEVCLPDDFVKKTMYYCQKRYASLGESKIRSEYIITAFYGAICVAIFYSQDKSIYETTWQFDYLNDHIDMEYTDVAAERLLQTKDGEPKANHIWSIISPYVQKSVEAFNEVGFLSANFVLGAMENAYQLGMLTANYYLRGRDKLHGLGTRAEIDAALEKLADSQDEYQEPPRTRTMCYSPKIPNEINIQCKCDKCGKNFLMSVYEGEEKIIERYRGLANEFVELGHKADIIIACEECAKQFYPSNWFTHHIIFSLTLCGSNNTVFSFPRTLEFERTEYDTALSFLKGSNTLSELAADTKTHFESAVYLQQIKTVLGVTQK